MYHHLYHNADNDADEEKHQEQNEEAHPIEKTKETARGENKPIRSGWKMAFRWCLPPHLCGFKEHPGDFMIYGPLGERVCCSHVACPLSHREMTTQCKPEDLTFDQEDLAVSQRLVSYEENYM